MTEEEKLVEEYIKANNLEWELECNRTNPIGEVKQAFLAGLKAQPKWHKVADGDLPKECTNVLINATDYGVNGYYVAHLINNKWWSNCKSEVFRHVIAWCEIPKYTKE